MTANYLSYWTDNGAFYYYHTDQDNNYEDQLQKVAQQDIPFQAEFEKNLKFQKPKYSQKYIQALKSRGTMTRGGTTRTLVTTEVRETVPIPR